MSLSGLAFFAFVYFIFVIIPGPGVAAMIARGLGTGTKGAAPYALGFMLGDMTWFTFAATGMAALANQFAYAFIVVKYAGCAYLLYLAKWARDVFRSAIALRRINRGSAILMAGAATVIALKG